MDDKKLLAFCPVCQKFSSVSRFLVPIPTEYDKEQMEKSDDYEVPIAERDYASLAMCPDCILKYDNNVECMDVYTSIALKCLCNKCKSLKIFNDFVLDEDQEGRNKIINICKECYDKYKNEKKNNSRRATKRT